MRALPTANHVLSVARALARNASAAGHAVMVMEDSDHVYDHVLPNLLAYADLVTPGSYLIVQDTRAGRMAGPTHAIAQFIALPAGHGRFVRDRRPEHFLISQHSGGFLRKLTAPNERLTEWNDEPKS
jgi:cephalosporin hydroxylase